MNMSAVVPFHFESHEVRALTIAGEPWFVAKDVCTVLEYADANVATQGLDEDEKLVHEIDGPGQRRNMLIISESGLYTLIIRSNKPQAKPFRKSGTQGRRPAMSVNVYLCAGCGREIPYDYWEPQVTGLCAECEEQILHSGATWIKDEETLPGSLVKGETP